LIRVGRQDVAVPSRSPRNVKRCRPRQSHEIQLNPNLRETLKRSPTRARSSSFRQKTTRAGPEGRAADFARKRDRRRLSASLACTSTVPAEELATLVSNTKADHWRW
jgi:hypothetical protein